MSDNVEMIGIVGRLSKQKKLIISGQDVTKENDQVASVSPTEQEIAFNASVEEAIINRTSVAAVDASVDERFVAAFWVITTLKERGKCFNYITSSNWVNGAIPVAEGLCLLNLLKEINNKTKQVTGGKIKTC